MAYRPLASEDRLLGDHITFPVSFIYGEHDWMCSRGSRQIVRANRYFKEGICQLHILENQDHTLMDDPIAFSRLLTADCLGKVSHRYQTLDYKIYFEDNDGDFINDNDDLKTLEIIC